MIKVKRKPFVDRVLRNDRLRDSERTLFLVHVGKCAGGTVAHSVLSSPIVRSNFTSFIHVHVEKPPVHLKSKYLFTVRNPISRSLSAFNWRYYKVVTTGQQKNRFPGESQILEKYGSLDALAKDLFFPSGRANQRAVDDWHAIHHLKEGFLFHLEDLLPRISSSQILGIITTEFFEEDMQNVLSLTDLTTRHAGKIAHPAQSMLSEKAMKHLKKFLAPEYETISKLLALHPIEPRKFAALALRDAKMNP